MTSNTHSRQESPSPEPTTSDSLSLPLPVFPEYASHTTDVTLHVPWFGGGWTGRKDKYINRPDVNEDLFRIHYKRSIMSLRQEEFVFANDGSDKLLFKLERQSWRTKLIVRSAENEIILTAQSRLSGLRVDLQQGDEKIRLTLKYALTAGRLLAPDGQELATLVMSVNPTKPFQVTVKPGVALPIVAAIVLALGRAITDGY